MTEQELSACGFFVPPSSEYAKPDPRGPEYGYFEAVIKSGSVILRKYSRNHLMQWNCVFHESLSFKNWAGENT